jgi:hypothetical protein
MSARESGVEHAGVKGEAEESPPAGIVLRDGDLPKIFDAVVAALAREATNLGIYAKGAQLVRPYLVTREGFPDATGQPSEVKILALAPVTVSALQLDLSSVIRFSCYRKSKPYKADCPKNIAQTFIDKRDVWGVLGHLDRISQVPIYDGKALHADRGLYRGHMGRCAGRRRDC